MELIRISKRIYKSALSALKLSDTEKIIPNLEALEKVGVAQDEIISKLCKKLVVDAKFKNFFLQDPKAAAGQVGIIADWAPVPYK
jgi:hypothetical protein